MVEYIYFVKCPDCEDEHFDFFDEAKCYAMRRLGQKPIITQTEVCRNDFGECTDHSDLGTVWSWEDLVGKDFVAEPVEQVFTKDDLKNLPVDNDPEFDDDDFYFNNNLVENAVNKISFKNNADRTECAKLCSEIGLITGEDLKKFMADQGADDSNLLGKLRAYRDELGDDFKLNPAERKPIPEGMTIEELVEEMEENEDTVECTWCEDLFDKSECRYEVDLGWLCSRCEAAIKSRGETLTFKENNYWDFLDEDVNEAEVETLHDLGNEYDGGYPAEGSKLAELEDADEYSKRLTTCPECGEKSFDHETGFCLECGFTTLTEDISEQTFASVNKDIEEIKDDLIKLAGNQQVIGKGLSVAFDNMEKQHKIILDKLDK